MKKGKSLSEWDHPQNVPTLSKKPGVGVREYPTHPKPHGYGHEVAGDSTSKLGAKKYGRGRARKQKAAAILAKARKGG